MNEVNANIEYVDRESGQKRREKVYGASAVDFAYRNPFGSWLTKNVLSKKFISQIVGLYKSTPLSLKGLPEFIQSYEIPMNEYEEPRYRSFNDFFIRRFKPGQRTFPQNAASMGAFAEARYVAFEKISPELTFPVKGVHLNAALLLGDAQKAALFDEGPMMIARLCPVDYHRFHFPDSGSMVERYTLSGKFHSVNPVALKAQPTIFLENERCVSILKTDNFGYLAYVEVGALCVGKIVQSTNEMVRFERGQEKGYFLFGGSTVIVLGEKGKWLPDSDILENTRKGHETFIKLGACIGKTR